MDILSFISQKGGSGKTTLALHIAVAAEQQGKKVALIDIDPQASSAAWHAERDADSPLLAQCHADELPEILQECRDSGMDLVVIDTAPHNNTEAIKAAQLSDLMLIPCRSTILDLRAIAPSIDIAQQAKTKVAVVFSACPPQRGMGEPTVVAEARQVLNDDYQVKVWKGRITQRAAYHYALIDSRAVTEFEPKGKSADEIRTLWKWIAGELKNG